MSKCVMVKTISLCKNLCKLTWCNRFYEFDWTTGKRCPSIIPLSLGMSLVIFFHQARRIQEYEFVATHSDHLIWRPKVFHITATSILGKGK